MPRRSLSAVDPVFAEITKAIYGDVDPRELQSIAKFGSPGAHIDGPLTAKQAADQRKVATVGLAATGVAGVAGLHAIKATVGENAARTAAADTGDVGGAAAKLAQVARLKPTTAAKVVGGGLLALHGVELLGDGLAAHAQTKALKAAQASAAKTNPNNPVVSKAFRLKPLNMAATRAPSLRAKRPKLAPTVSNPTARNSLYQPVSKGVRAIIRNAEFVSRNAATATGHASDAARQAAEAGRKINALIPSPRTVGLVGAGTAAAVGGASYAGSYAGNRRANKKLVPVTAGGRVGKSALTEVTWTGLISKVDTEARQVFGWASVSRLDGHDVVDLQGDIVPIDEVEKSAYRYVLESRKGGDMHKRVSKLDDGTQPLHTSDMIESFVVTPEKLQKMGLPPDALPHGWWVGYHVNDDAQWAMVKSGERAGFSIHGSGTRTAVSKAADRPKLKVRAQQAIHPPAVTLKPVKSVAISSMGYQPQTKRLAVEMHSRPGAPYLYRMPRGQAEAALSAPSLGRHYATAIRGKAKRADRFTLADRARLFADPQVSKGLLALKGVVADAKKAPAALLGATKMPAANPKLILKPIAAPVLPGGKAITS